MYQLCNPWSVACCAEKRHSRERGRWGGGCACALRASPLEAPWAAAALSRGALISQGSGGCGTRRRSVAQSPSCLGRARRPRSNSQESTAPLPALLLAGVFCGMSMGGGSSDVENHKHRMLATEYGIRGYTPAEPQKNHLRAGEVHANELARKLVTDTSAFADRPVQAFKGSLGENARVLIGILTCNGKRIEDGLMIKQSRGGKAWGRIEKERKQAKDAGEVMSALELMEYSLVARTQIHGFWSDSDHSDIEKVTADNVMDLVREYNDVAPQCDDRLVAMNLLRAADRLTADPGLVGQTSETRKLRVLTLTNIASQWRRRGRLTDAQRCLQTAQVVVDTLGTAPGRTKAANQVSEHAICVLRVRAEGLLNLDENGIGGLSDPFLRISRMVNAAETERDMRKLESKYGSGVRSRVNLRSWGAAKDAVVVQTRQVTGKTVHKTEVVMNSLAPQWKRCRIAATQLCGCNLGRKIALAVLDWDRDGTHDLIGSAELSFLEMQKHVRTGEPVPIRPDGRTEGDASGLLYFEEAWVSNVEGERLQMLRGELMLQRASVKWLLNQHSEALADATTSLAELLSDRNLTRAVYATEMDTDKVEQLIRGRKVESSLLLGVCFECCAALSQQLRRRQDQAAFSHNAVLLLQKLRTGYEDGSLKYKEDSSNEILSQHKGDVLLDAVSETVHTMHETCAVPFDRLVEECRQRCLPETLVARTKTRAISKQRVKKQAESTSPDEVETNAAQRRVGKSAAKRVKRVGSAPAIIRSHAKPVAGVVPPCDSLGRSVQSWTVKRAENGGPGPRVRPQTAAGAYPVLPRGGSASRVRRASTSKSFVTQFPMSAQWLSHARPSTAGSQRSSDVPSPLQVWSRMSPAQQHARRDGHRQRPGTAGGFAREHGRRPLNFAHSGLM